MKDPGSEHSTHGLNARLLRFRSQAGSEDPVALAEALIAAQRYGDARGVAVSAQSPDHEDGTLLILEGRAWLLERDLVRAQAALLRAVRAAPQLAEGYRWLGHVLLKRGDPQRAVKTLRRALMLEPEDAEARKLLIRAEHLCEAASQDAITAPSEPPILRGTEGPPAPSRRPAARGSQAPPASPRAVSGREPRPPQPTAAGARPAAPGREPAARRGPPAPPVATERPREDPERAPPVLFAEERAQTPPPRGRAAEAEPTSRFRRLAGGEGQSDSGPIASLVPHGQDAGSGRYSAHDLTAEQIVAPFVNGASRPISAPLDAARAGSRSASGTLAAPRAGSRSSAGALGAPRAAFDAGQPPAGAADRSAALAGADELAAALRDRSLTPVGGSTVPPARDGSQRPVGESATPQRARPAAAADGRATAESARSARKARAGALAGAAEERAADEPVPSALQSWSDAEPDRLTAPGPSPATADGPGVPADAEQAFELIQSYGLFEEPRAAAPQWTPAGEVEPRGTRVRNAVIGLWVLTLVGSAAGYFGWQLLIAQRHARATRWVNEARSLMQRGDHAGLVDAERLLRLAREQHPAASEIPLEALLLQVERVLDDGERDLAALKSAIARAPTTPDGKAAQAVAAAVIGAFGGDALSRDRLFEQAAALAPGDARRGYFLGRLEQRLGRGLAEAGANGSGARARLAAASAADPKLVPAALALAALALEDGERAEALQRVDAVLAANREHLRARVLRLFISADDAEPAALQATLAGLAPAMKLAGPIDRLLLALSEARALRRQGKLEPAASAVERADAAGVDDPQLMAWVAREALAVNKPALAQHAASQALRIAPDVARYRRLLARVLVERGDGARARELLVKLPLEDGEAQIMKARAALLDEDGAALRAGLDALAQLAPGQAGSAVFVAALKIRLESKLTPGRPVVERAKALARSAPGDPEALLALAEAGLAAHDAVTATGALKQRFAVAPDDPNAHYLLGRARRMAADAPGAEASLRKALMLSPGQNDVLVALGGLLLDQGKYDEADAVFQELASRGGSATAGRLGRVEALIGLGRVADAQVQLDALPDAQGASIAQRSAAARLSLARGKPGDALAPLRALLEAQPDEPALFALYGDALYAAEQVDSAAGAYDKALALDAGLPEALLGRAETYLRANRAKEAMPLLDDAREALASRIRAPAQHAQRLSLLGQAYLLRNKRGDVELAKQALRESSKLAGAPADAFFLLGESLGGKVTPEARASYQRYLELAPGGKYAERARRALGPLQ